MFLHFLQIDKKYYIMNTMVFIIYFNLLMPLTLHARHYLPSNRLDKLRKLHIHNQKTTNKVLPRYVKNNYELKNNNSIPMSRIKDHSESKLDTTITDNNGNKNHTFRIGLSIEKANYQFGISALVDVFFSNRFSLTTGVKILNEVSFDDQYYYKKDAPLENYADSSGTDSSIIQNIQQQTVILQLPIAITYYHPLKKNYSLVFAFGTEIDLSVSRVIQYDQIEPSDPTSHQQQIKLKTQPVLLNNLFFSSGIQKKIGNSFAIQATAFISPQIKEVIYKSDNLYYGLQLKAMYCF